MSRFDPDDYSDCMMASSHHTGTGSAIYLSGAGGKRVIIVDRVPEAGPRFGTLIIMPKKV